MVPNASATLGYPADRAMYSLLRDQELLQPLRIQAAQEGECIAHTFSADLEKAGRCTTSHLWSPSWQKGVHSDHVIGVPTLVLGLIHLASPLVWTRRLSTASTERGGVRGVGRRGHDRSVQVAHTGYGKWPVSYQHS